MARHSSKNIHFDTLLVGDGLTHLLLATVLQADRKVALVCSGSQLGSVEALDYIPKSNESLVLIQWLENLLNIQLIAEEVEHAPVSVQSGQLLDFSGFGDLQFEHQDYLNFYNSQSYYKLNLSTQQIMNRLKELYKGEILYSSELTSIELESSQVSSISLNGDKTVTADEYIFEDSPAKLLSLMPIEELPHQFVQKVKNIKEYMGIQLRFRHREPVVDHSHLHVLFGSKADFEPCLGRFIIHQPTSEVEVAGGVQSSLWVSLVEADLVDGPEHLGSVVKYMKRQIKRAYADWGATEGEKITVFSNYSGSLTDSREELSSKSKLKNLYLSSPILSHSEGLLAHLEVSQSLLEKLLITREKTPLSEASLES